jgi:prolyl oligopeptidase
MRALLAAFALTFAVPVLAQEAKPLSDTAYLEEIEGERALAFARAENARSLPVLQNDPRYQTLYKDALAIATAKDRIPAVSFVGDGSLRNFWQDTQHVRGILRKTTLASYQTANPQWETLFDLDAISKAENANWVFKGMSCLAPDDQLCLAELSRGGEDAVTVREYDIAKKAFVSGGFVSDRGKQDVTWLDKDTVLIGRGWGEGTLTKSGYPYIVKAWKRGTPISEATEIFRGQASDVAAQPSVLRDADGKVQAVLGVRAVSFFETEYHLLDGGKATRLPFPLRATLQGLVDGQLVFTIEQDWAEKGFKSGDLLAYDLAALKANPASAKPVLVLRPSESQSVEQVATTRSRLIVALFDNVKGAVVSYAHGPQGWTSRKLALPENSTVGVSAASDRDDKLMISVAGFLTPSTLWLGDAATGDPKEIKRLPARFDASKHVVEQLWASSSDGTKIPYFVVRPKDLKYDGSAPTLLNAYGGFQVSQTPVYSGTIGKLWLERGGVFVMANIRGGGEFGPRWHEAGLKANRQKVYDDFFAVSQDLIARKITSPRRLGIMGGSNGGLLMGVALTQKPELYRAIVVQVPLFDMINYTRIGAGASWVGEYGDPGIAAERAVIEKYSPLQNLKAGKAYPLVYIETSTKDDRVHPYHARVAAERLKALGYPYLYYENIDGGHAAAANLEETAKRVALEYTYLSQRLMD